MSSCQSISSKQENNIDTYHGIQVVDNYKYLEDLENEEVLNWLKKQNTNAENVLNKIVGREKLISIQEILSNNNGNNEITDLTLTRNNKLFYLKRAPEDDYPKLYSRTGIKGIEQLLFNPQNNPNSNKYISYFKPTWDGTKLVFGLSEKGKEFSELQIIDVTTNKILPILIKKALPSYGGIYWLPDNSGVIYIQAPVAKNTKDAYLNMEMMLRKLDKQESTVLFSKKNNPKIKMKPEDLPIVFNYDYDKKYLYSAISGAAIYQDYYYSLVSDLKKDKLNWKPLFKKEDKITLYYRDRDEVFYLTSKDASNFKICSKTLSNPKTIKTVVKEKKGVVIVSFRLIKQGLVYTTTKNGVETRIFLLHHNGETEELELPFPAGKVLLRTKGEQSDFLSIIAEGWLNKKQRYVYDFSKKEFEIYGIQKYNSNDFTKKIIVKELNAPSHDGELVPLSLIYNRNLKIDGSNPTLMIAYGAYGKTMKPAFSKKILTWVREGGIFAVAHVRGGREKGDAWYKGGLKGTKPNTWKDAIASAEYLIKNKFTSPDRMVINGVSAGGIAVGRAMTERPDLFKAVIISSGKLNTLRSELGYNGQNNIKEYGSVKDSIGFKNLFAMDAYHHIKKGTNYPATLITTGLNDSRVPSWHSAKFAAKLLERNASDNPIFLSVSSNAGHGFDTSKKKKEEKVAQELSFAFWQTGHPDYQPQQ